MEYLVDTNVLLRFLQLNDANYFAIREAVRLLKSRRDHLYTSSQNIAEFWNVCTRPANVRGGIGLSNNSTEHRLRLLERHFIVLADSPLVYDEWKMLLLKYNVSGVNVYDAKIVAQMKIYNIKNLITFNVKDFSRYKEINIYEPRMIK